MNSQKHVQLLAIFTFAIISTMSMPAFAQQASVPMTAGNPADLVGMNAGECGQVDLTFAIDTTGSMGGAIGNVVANLPAIIAQADDADTDSARLGLITFNGQSGADFATVIHELSDPRVAVEATLAGLTTLPPGGGGSAEASNLAKRYAIENSNGFTAPWIGDTNILVVITDNPPGGANDLFEVGIDDVDMAQLGTDAANHVPNILVSDVNVAGSEVALTRDVLTADAVNSGGVYTFTSNGVDTAQAIIDIIAECGGTGDVVGGNLLSIDTTSLILAGAQNNAVWLMSALAVIGSIAFGALYVTSKKN